MSPHRIRHTGRRLVRGPRVVGSLQNLSKGAEIVLTPPVLYIVVDRYL